MKTTRRNFLKGLLATAGAAILAPQALVEKVHGASDLTPQERDIAADVMGLRRETWAGWSNAVAIVGRGSCLAVDNFGMTIVGVDSAARSSFSFLDDDLLWDLSKGGPLEFTIHGTYSEPIDGAALRDMLRGDGTDIISDTTPTWGGENAKPLDNHSQNVV